jgi:hypothetical protein
MSTIALITWIITALGGLYLLAIWLIEYDREFQGAAATRLPVPVILTHALLAVSGLVLWIVFLAVDQQRLAWAAVVVLGTVAVLGLFMAARWIGVYRAAAAPGRTFAAAGPGSLRADTAPIPPERHFPVSVVVAHGIFAVTTLVLVVLTAL